MSISVLIADDQPLMRGALRMYLSAEQDIEVVGEAEDGLQAVEMAERLRPDVVIMDVRMPELDGVTATQRLMAGHDGDSGTKVLVITTFDLDEYLVDALRAGASGFLLKDAQPDQLIAAVREISAGNALLSPAVTRRLLEMYVLPAPPAAHAAKKRLDLLTARELGVLQLVARGMTNAEIGSTLHVAESSVKTHVGHLLTKLGLGTRVHLVIFAYESGLAR